MKRRQFLAASAATLAAPAVRAADAAKTIKFTPQADLALLDPVFTTGLVTRNHGMMVYDQLYGLDDSFQPQPQMVDGHVVDDGGKTWTITLRDGLMFHDGQRVRARDAVASIQRWGKIDAFGQHLMAVTNELTATS
ncbi:MAG: ABC transporter substrate-binding protein, partial [Rhodospirillales bacterium]|nr:ABC transporter substrate-binding protein [Rhodospirillales bacterium]